MARTPEQIASLNDALRLGVAKGDEEMIRLGLEKGGGPDFYLTEVSNRGALGKQSEDMLLLALKKGGDPNLLLFAAIEGRVMSAAKLAVEQGGADVNCTHARPGKPETVTIAEWSYRNFNSDISDYLCGRGMNVDIQSADGATNLLRAVNDRIPERALHYLKHGANPFIADADGIFPLRVTQDCNFRDGRFYEKKDELIRAMLKNVPDEADQPAPSPSAPFNAVVTANDVSVNHPLELKCADNAAPPPREKPAKGFQL